MSGFKFERDGVTFVVQKRGYGFRVAIHPEEENWDYDDEFDAKAMTLDVLECKSYDEAAEILLG